jgi:hypothetical protein
MRKRRWWVLVGPPIILLAVVGFAVLGRGEAVASRAGTLPRFTACSSAVATTRQAAEPGTWWKTSDALDASGALIRRLLFVGKAGAASGRIVLGVESAVSGPINGLVVLASDDGSHSQVRLVSVADNCEVLIDDRADVVRTVILNAHDGSVFAHVVGRETRDDLGTFRISPTAEGHWQSQLAAPPLAGALATDVGQVYGTGLHLDRGGKHLAIQSCTDLACLTRVFDLAHPDLAPVVLRGTDHGPMLGFAGSDLITWGACLGYPCPVFAWDTATGEHRQLSAQGTSVAITANGRRLVIVEGGAAGSRTIEVDAATGRSTPLRGLQPGLRPLSVGPGATIGLEVAADEVPMAAVGGDPLALRPDDAAVEALP